MKLSIIVPVFNEEDSILQLLKKLESVNFGLKKEVIIVNDGSRDGTEKIIKGFIKNKKDYFLLHKDNGGKGSAIIKGIKNSSGDIIVIQDADLEYNPEELKKLVFFLKDNEEKVVYGSRFLDGKNYYFSKYYFANRLLSFFCSVLFFQRITDMETCYKVFEAQFIKGINLVSKGFEIEPEITAKILKKGIRIKEVAISYSPRKKSEGKKIKLRDGFKAVWCLIKFRFSE
jgi:dolichol-phosphate mannosyltransferase